MKRSNSFWKVAVLLTIANVLTGLCVLYVNYQFTSDQNLSYTKSLVRDYVDNLSMEIEARTFATDDQATLSDVSERLLVDLSTRFADQIHLLTAQGDLIKTVQPNRSLFPSLRTVAILPEVPVEVNETLSLPNPKPMIHVDQDGASSWALAPVFNAGQLVGGVLVHPLTNTLDIESARFEMPFRRTALLLVAFSLVMGLLLGYVITYRLHLTQS